MRSATVEKVPQVQGKSSALMHKLMELALGDGLWGCEKLCTALYLPGFEALGMRESGEVWNEPRSASN